MLMYTLERRTGSKKQHGNDTTFLKSLFYFSLFSYVYVSMYMWCRCPQEPEEGVSSPGAGVTGGCEILDMSIGIHLRSSERAITTWPSLQS